MVLTGFVSKDRFPQARTCLFAPRAPSPNCVRYINRYILQDKLYEYSECLILLSSVVPFLVIFLVDFIQRPDCQAMLKAWLYGSRNTSFLHGAQKLEKVEFVHLCHIIFLKMSFWFVP